MRGEFVDVGGVRLYYFAAGTRGEGEPIIFLHGFPTSSHLWSSVVTLVPKGHRVVVVDLLGYGRSDRLPDGVVYDERGTYELPERLRLNQWALAGEWTVGHERVVLDRGGGSIAYRFHARDAHLVLSPGTRGSTPFRVLLDGEAPGRSHGVDVDEEGYGLLRVGRLYQLVRQPDGVAERTLEVSFAEPGVEAYAFTFG